MEIKKLKVVFIVWDNYEYERIGVQILSSIALEEGFRRELLILSSVRTEEALKMVMELQPEIVAYSAMTFEQEELHEFNKLLKDSGLKFISIFGGSHYTFNPEEIYHNLDIDIICRGEGEIAFRSFIRAVQENREYHDIENLWVRKGDRIIENSLGSLITDLDSIPFPDRELIPLNLEGEQIAGKSLKVVITRGCPNQCTYCFNSGWNKLYRGSKICRYRSVENIITEVRQILDKYKLDFIFFGDDNFTIMPVNFIRRFCEEYKKEINRPFAAIVRAEFITEELVILLKDAGLFFVSIGIECGNEDIAKNFLKRGNITNCSIINAFELFNKHCVKTSSNNMVALPVDNPLELDLETIKLNIRCKPTWAKFAIFIPIPKTEIWKFSIENDYLNKNAFLRLKKTPSVLTYSTLNFDRKLARRLNNLHKFASITVKFPALLPFVKILIQLPENPLYLYLNFLWYGYWNTIGLYNVKISPEFMIRGIKTINKYLKKH